MKNFSIQNKEENVIIDILGDIGENWFGDGITAKDIVNQLREYKGKDLTINVMSLGGAVFEAFAMYDFIKMHEGRTTVNIIGATASSGTVIAMAGDEVDMSENAWFLVHNAWTEIRGNAKELRETAEYLDNIDDKLASIYQKKINKNGKNKKKSEILSLMEEERWIDASEAIAWGFVNQVIKDKRVIENSVKEKINNSYLPKIKNMGFIDKMREVFGIEATDETAVNDSIVNAKLNFENEIKIKNEEIEQLKTDVQTGAEKVAELETELEKVKTENVDAIGEVNNKVAEKETAIADLQAKYDAMELELNTLKASKTNPVNSGDPSISGGNVEKSKAQKIYQAIMPDAANRL